MLAWVRRLHASGIEWWQREGHCRSQWSGRNERPLRMHSSARAGLCVHRARPVGRGDAGWPVCMRTGRARRPHAASACKVPAA